jgi:putative ABC transport system permease protein
MRITDTIARAARSLRQAKGRTILTSLAIAVGALTLTITMAAGNGIRAYTDRLVANNFDPSESIVGRDKEIANTGAPDGSPKEYDDSVTSLSFGGSGGSVQIKQVTDADILEIEKLPYVESVRPNYQISPRYVTREGSKKYTLSLEAYNPGQKPELVAGTLPAKDLAGDDVVLPEGYVSLLGFRDAKDALGKTVTVTIQQPYSQEALQEFVMKSLAGQSQRVNLSKIPKISP